MRKFAKLSLFTLAVHFALTYPTALHSVPYSWTGATNDNLALNTNWSPAVTPASGDVTLFDAGTALSLTPELIQPDTLDILSMNFIGTPGSFNFTIDGQDVSTTFLGIGSGGVGGGVFNTYPSTESISFTGTGGSLIQFISGSSADGNFSGSVNYSIDANNGIVNTLKFIESKAGKANISCFSFTASPPSLVRFESNSDAEMAIINTLGGKVEFSSSTAGSSHINIADSSMDFSGSATAASSIINIDSNGTLNFFNTSTLGDALINVTGSAMNFNSTNANSTANVKLARSAIPATMLLQNNLTLSSLAIDADSSALLGSNTLTVGDGTNRTIIGTISGAGGKFTKQGNGKITLSGINTYSGGTSILAGTLQVTSYNLPSGGNILINDGTLLFAQPTSGSFDGKILAGTGTIQKTGYGELVFSNDNSGFSGSTLIQQGRLTIDQKLGGNVTIDQTGILGGNGTVLGNVLLKSGMISPGASIGTLNIAGNFQQNAAGIYELEVNSTGQSDLINVAGTAAIDGTLYIVFLGGSVDTTKIYTILHAEGGVTGQYANTTFSTIPLFVPHIDYQPKDVNLTFDFIFSAISEDYNQQKIADQLLTIVPGDASQELIDFVGQLYSLSSQPETIDSARQAMSQMTGEQYSNLLLSAELTGRQFIRRLYEPLRGVIVRGSSCCSGDVYYNCYDNNGCICLAGDPWKPDTNHALEPWMEVSGGHTFFRHDHNAHGFKANNYDISLGVQSALFDLWTLGIAGSYAYDHVHYNIGGNGNFNSGLVALYTLYRPQSYYILSDLVFDYSCGKVKRPIDVGETKYQARSKPTLTETLFYIELGKDVCFTSLLLQPFLGIEVDFFSGRTISEHGASPINLKINKKSRTSALSRLGLHMSTTPLCSWTVNFDLAWQYRMTSTRNHIRENFQSFGNTFNIKGVTLPRNTIEATLNLSTMVCDTWEFFINVNAQRWQRGSNYNFLGGLKYSW